MGWEGALRRNAGEMMGMVPAPVFTGEALCGNNGGGMGSRPPSSRGQDLRGNNGVGVGITIGLGSVRCGSESRGECWGWVPGPRLHEGRLFAGTTEGGMGPRPPYDARTTRGRATRFLGSASLHSE